MHGRNFLIRAGVFCLLALTIADPAVGQFGPGFFTGGAQAVIIDEVDSLAHTAPVFPVDAKGKIISITNVTQQVNATIANLDAVLKIADSAFRHIAKLNVYIANDGVFEEVRAALTNRFADGPKPAISFVTTALMVPGAMVAMDAVAVARSEKSVKLLLRADGDSISPVSILPPGPKLFVSGMADASSLLPATRKTLEKLVAALGHLGSKPGDIAQLKVFLQPMIQAGAVREVIAEFFGGKAPPVVMVEWISSSPVVEIELVAMAHGDFKREPNSVSYLTPPDTTSSKVYSRVARVNHGKLIYYPNLYSQKAVNGVEQVEDIFAQLRDITVNAAAPSDLEHLVKATYYVTDEAASKALNDLRPKYYNPLRPPAASKAKVKGVGVTGRTVTMDMIAVTK